MKTILITGINGFLGSHLAKVLKNDYKVIGLEYSIKNLFRLTDESFKVYDNDYDLIKIFEKYDIFAIFHMATFYRKESSIKSLFETNILLPIKLLEISEKFGVKAFFNSDSFFNSGKYSYSYLSEYTLSKKQSLEWLKLLKNKCKLINMKIFHMYGLGDSSTKFIPKIIMDIKSNKKTIHLTSGLQKRDFIYVSDVVNAYAKVLQNLDKIENYIEFEVGTGVSISIRDFVSCVKVLSESQSDLCFGSLPMRDGEIMLSKAKNDGLLELGWLPKVSIKNGIKIMIS